MANWSNNRRANERAKSVCEKMTPVSQEVVGDVGKIIFYVF